LGSVDLNRQAEKADNSNLSFLVNTGAETIRSLFELTEKKLYQLI
jgi:hypothetical protein